MHSRAKWFVTGVAVLGALAFVSVLVGARPERNDSHAGTVTIGNKTIQVEIMRSPAEQARGLSGRDTLSRDEGMLFVFDVPKMSAFWMKEMRFPIDIIWIANGVVVGVEKNIDPQIGVAENELRIYTPPEPVDSVLEVSSGVAEEAEWSMGDAVQISK
jgi:uncharacterized membrane protein (UPF0127 family)